MSYNAWLMFLKEWLNTYTIQDGYSLGCWQTHICLDNGTDSFIFLMYVCLHQYNTKSIQLCLMNKSQGCMRKHSIQIVFSTKSQGLGEGDHSIGKNAMWLNSSGSIGEERLYIMGNLHVLDSHLAHENQHILSFLLVLLLLLPSK